MTHRRIRIDVFQVLLHHGSECTVQDRYNRQYDNDVGIFLCTFGHQVRGHTQATIATQLHGDPRQEHGPCCWCG